jgi:phosphoribosylformylglycinamidine synthase
MNAKVNALVLYGYGLNCDHETAHALELAGARAQRVHINSLISREVTLDDFRIMAFVGGFSWGDDHGAGVIQGHRFKTRLGDDLIDFIARGGLVIGICNGFQTLVNLGLLPGCDNDYRTRSVALIANDCGSFRNDWAHLRANEASPCVFTAGMTTFDLPVRHGEGKFFCEPEMLARLTSGNQIVLRYADESGRPAGGKFPENPNGSLDDIAGICDTTGRVFGLMPHPEAFHHPTNHPAWTRRKAQALREGRPFPGSPMTDGVRLLKNGVDYAAGR